MPYLGKGLGLAEYVLRCPKIVSCLTQGRYGADEGHCDGEVDVAVEEDAPEVGASTACLKICKNYNFKIAGESYSYLSCE